MSLSCAKANIRGVLSACRGGPAVVVTFCSRDVFCPVRPVGPSPRGSGVGVAQSFQSAAKARAGLATKIRRARSSPSSRASRGRRTRATYGAPVSARAAEVTVSPPSSSCPAWPRSASSARLSSSRQSVAWCVREGPSKTSQAPRRAPPGAARGRGSGRGARAGRGAAARRAGRRAGRARRGARAHSGAPRRVARGVVRLGRGAHGAACVRVQPVEPARDLDQSGTGPLAAHAAPHSPGQLLDEERATSAARRPAG